MHDDRSARLAHLVNNFVNNLMDLHFQPEEIADVLEFASMAARMATEAVEVLTRYESFNGERSDIAPKRNTTISEYRRKMRLQNNLCGKDATSRRGAGMENDRLEEVTKKYLDYLLFDCQLSVEEIANWLEAGAISFRKRSESTAFLTRYQMFNGDV